MKLDKFDKAIVKRNEKWIANIHKEITWFESEIEEKRKEINDLAGQSRVLKGRV